MKQTIWIIIIMSSFGWSGYALWQHDLSEALAWFSGALFQILSFPDDDETPKSTKP